MSVLCKLGIHAWKACQCERCGMTSDTRHQWHGCKCKYCGKIRDKAHDWDDCKCRRCGKSRNVVHGRDGSKSQRDQDHSWDGCKCRLCGKTRDEGHEWDGCKCIACGSVRDEDHQWIGCSCKKCLKSRDQEHHWSGCTCRLCKATRHNPTFCKCEQCGTELPHPWNGCKCISCGKIRDREHVWQGDRCGICGAIRKVVPGRATHHSLSPARIRHLVDDLERAYIGGEEGYREGNPAPARWMSDVDELVAAGPSVLPYVVKSLVRVTEKQESAHHLYRVVDGIGPSGASALRKIITSLPPNTGVFWTPGSRVRHEIEVRLHAWGECQ